MKKITLQDNRLHFTIILILIFFLSTILTGIASSETVVSISPEKQLVERNQSFTVNISIEPDAPISGAQFNFIFNNSLANIKSVQEGNMLSQTGAKTYFSNGTVDSSTGLIKHIYSSVLGNSSVSSPGILATINLTAGSRTGVAKFNLSNVVISGSGSNPVQYTTRNASVLIDTAPVLDLIGSRSVNEAGNLTFKVNASDADGNNLTFSASGLPAGATFNQSTRVFTWVPSKGQAGNYTVTFKVSDGYLNDSENVKITVNQLNNASVLIDTAPVLGLIGPKSVNETNTLNFKINASDADSNSLTLSVSGLPKGAIFNQSTGVFTWIPSKGQAGNYTVTFKVSDGYLNDSEEVKITVKQLNSAPDITSFTPANGSVFIKGQKIKIALKASDADNQALSYTIKIDGKVYSTSSSYVWNTKYSSSGSHTIEVIVSDGIVEVKKLHTVYVKNYCSR
jgi:hypothetical protein